MLINVYTLDRKSPMGFGDFIRGCIACHQLSLKNEFPFDINLKRFSKFYKSEETLLKKSIYTKLFPKCLDINELEEKLDSLAQGTNLNDTDFFILTNAWPKNTIEKQKTIEGKIKQKGWGKISKETKDFIKSRLIPSDFQLSFIKNVPEKYEVVHIRAGDGIAFKNEVNDESLNAHDAFDVSLDSITKATISRISKILKTAKDPLVILSDSAEVKNNISIQYSKCIDNGKIIISNVDTKHSGVNGLKETFHDLTILNNAKTIHQLSVYNWGSGFSNIAHHIYDVPIKRYPKLK
jgi:hypothetical protein